MDVTAQNGRTRVTASSGDGRRWVLRLGGDVDMAAIPALEDRLDDIFAPGLDELVVDLHETTLLDSSALATLVLATRRAEAADAEVVFESPSRGVRRIFEITGLDRVLRVAPAADDAGEEGSR